MLKLSKIKVRAVVEIKIIGYLLILAIVLLALYMIAGDLANKIEHLVSILR